MNQFNRILYIYIYSKAISKDRMEINSNYYAKDVLLSLNKQ